MYLIPNQKVAYAPVKIVLTPVLVNIPVIVNPIKKQRILISNKPLFRALERLKQVYDIDIFMKNKELEHCYFTGNLNGLSLSEQLDLICKTVEAKHQKYETAI